MDSLKVVAVATSDNGISVWDFIGGGKLLFSFDVHHTILSSIQFFRTYQVLITNGFDNIMCVYEMDGRHNDASKVGQLNGHVSIITAFKGIEGTPMVVSADDKVFIRIWDIRTCMCIQTIGKQEDQRTSESLFPLSLRPGVPCECTRDPK